MARKILGSGSFGGLLVVLTTLALQADMLPATKHAATGAKPVHAAPPPAGLSHPVAIGSILALVAIAVGIWWIRRRRVRA